MSLIILVAASSSCRKDKKTLPQPEQVTIAGRAYPVVKIGAQTWTAMNYGGPGGINYDQQNSKPEYGKYYTLQEIRQVQVPAGWRVPTVGDYLALLQSQGITVENYAATNQPAVKKLASKTRWRNIAGNNESGFNAFPAGYSFRESVPMDGDISEFWTSEGITMSIQEGSNGVHHRIAFYSNSSDPGYRFNLRFVKDN